MHASAVLCVWCGGAKELAWQSALVGAAWAQILSNMHVLPVHAHNVSEGQWHGIPAFLDCVTTPKVVRLVLEVGGAAHTAPPCLLTCPPPTQQPSPML